MTANFEKTLPLETVMGTNNYLCDKNSPLKMNPSNSISTLENIVVNAKEHKILKRCKRMLEKCYSVQLFMPKNSSLESDVIFVSIKGKKSNVENVKKFLAKQVSESDSQPHDKDEIIILSDSEDESSSSAESENISIIELDSEDIQKSNNKVSQDDSVCIIESPSCSGNTNIINSQQSLGKKRKRNFKKVRSKIDSSSLDADASDLCEVTSTTDDDMVSKKAKLSDSVLILEEPTSISEPALDFIPLHIGNKSTSTENEHTNKSSCNKSMKSNEIKNDDDIIIIDEPVPRRLRPIVIDGSNVAMEHGASSSSYSVKGIKLAVDYFLARGHTQVTAFVPKFRKSYNPNRKTPTTDCDLFNELQRNGHVVFTPSRRIDGKCINSYDDRYILKLAVSNGGVIVSNDNFRDLIDECDEFKEIVQKRLLMFCFVGDMFMVPDDPLGRNGPKLSDFLSFPPESTET